MISDTHGLLRPEAEAALRGSDLILHAGDVGDGGMLERLGALAPVHAVRGNTDAGVLRRKLPASVVVDLGSADGRLAETAAGSAAVSTGPLAYIHHGDRDLDLDPAAAGISLVVSGHTHAPLVRRREGVLYLNPGSAGPRRFSLPVTLARVTLEGADMEVEIVDLVAGEKAR